MAFEWRPNYSKPKFDPSEGGLFTCSPHRLNKDGSPILEWVFPSRSWPEAPPSFSAGPNSTVTPSAGDDLSPPNAVQAKQINGIALPISTSAGWSESPMQLTGVYPSEIEYNVRLVRGSGMAEDALQVSSIWEYTNPRFIDGESMMVKVSIAKTKVQDEKGTTLDLVATRFAEYNTAKQTWINITANVDYTTTAEEVVKATLEDSRANQTAGVATVKPKTIELTLGPFSNKARIELTFQARNLYSYDAMSINPDASDIGTQRLLPLWISLPFAPFDHEAGLCKVRVGMQAPAGTAVLPFDKFQPAYEHLKSQDVMKSTTILAVTDLMPQKSDDSTGFRFKFDSLPPRSCGILAWFSLRNDVGENMMFDFVDVGKTISEDSSDSLAQNGCAIIQTPTSDDVSKLQVPLPGYSPIGNLWRIKVKTPHTQTRSYPILLLNITMSDKSGSTCRTTASGTTMRQRFNELAEARFLKRLESIPALVAAGVIRMDDVYMDVFLPFDDSAPDSSIHHVVFRIDDVFDDIIQCVEGIRCNTTNLATAKFGSIVEHVRALRSIRPGGLTDFSAAPRTLQRQYVKWLSQAKSMLQTDQVTACTFVEFDTDGGHNGAGNYLDTLRNFCNIASVRSGVVTGFGSWLNQECASNVARVLGSLPAMLSLEVPKPGAEGLNRVFRCSFAAWISAIKQPPKLILRVSAGHVSFATPGGRRIANAIEVLAARFCEEDDPSCTPKFGLPDISDETVTKTVIKDVLPGREFVMYVISRIQNASDLAGLLDIQCKSEGSDDSTGRAQCWTKVDTCQGSYLAFDWLEVLTCKTGQNFLQIAPLMQTSLATRLEDEVSFRFNLASPSGKTSYVGRSKTNDRKAIDSLHQPTSPDPPIPSSKLSFSFITSQQSDGIRCQHHAPTPMYHGRRTVPLAGGGCFGSASASFGAPTAAGGGMFGSHAQMPASTTRAMSGSNSLTSPQVVSPIRWVDAIMISMGSNWPQATQDYENLKQAMTQIAHARKRVLADPTVALICDVCKRVIAQNEPRYHCYDCQDFDTCYGCRDKHLTPFHRLVLVSSVLQSNVLPEDPLVSSLLDPPSASFASTSHAYKKPPRIDCTMTWCRKRLRRFLLAILHWWPLFRASCPFWEKLPGYVSDDMVQKIICSCCQVEDPGSSEKVEELVTATSAVLESLLREDKDYFSRQNVFQ